MHSDVQEECGTSRLVTALVLKFSGVQWDIIAVLTSYLMLNTRVHSTSLHSLMFSVSLHCHICISAQYRRIVMCGGLYAVHSKPFCMEDTLQDALKVQCSFSHAEKQQNDFSLRHKR